LLPKKPELTTTGLSDKTKAPIILELLEVRGSSFLALKHNFHFFLKYNVIGPLMGVPSEMCRGIFNSYCCYFVERIEAKFNEVS
jgi:hypothetical protein